MSWAEWDETRAGGTMRGETMAKLFIAAIVLAWVVYEAGVTLAMLLSPIG